MPSEYTTAAGRFLAHEYVPWNGKLKYDWSLGRRKKKDHGRESNIIRNTVNRGKYLRLLLLLSAPVAKV